MLRVRLAHLRLIVGATVLAGLTALVSAGIALAEGGGGPWPK